MNTPQIIHDLVERFERNYEAYKSGSYNETQVRREFVDPLQRQSGVVSRPNVGARPWPAPL